MDNMDILDLLKELIKWQRIQGLQYLRKLVDEGNLFSDEKHILIYYHSDGQKSGREIAKIVGVSHTTIQNLWKEWTKIGIVLSSQKYKGGQYIRLFDLNDFGLDIPSGV